jgi:hypothetical protein
MGLKSRHCATQAYGSATALPYTVPPAPSVSASLPHSPASRATRPLPALAASAGCRCWVALPRRTCWTGPPHFSFTARRAGPHSLPFLLLPRCAKLPRPRASLRPRRAAMALARLKSCCQAPHSLLSMSLATEAAPPRHHSQRWRHHPPYLDEDHLQAPFSRSLHCG